jgi:hypothetical protein
MPHARNLEMGISAPWRFNGVEIGGFPDRVTTEKGGDTRGKLKRIYNL